MEIYAILAKLTKFNFGEVYMQNCKCIYFEAYKYKNSLFFFNSSTNIFFFCLSITKNRILCTLDYQVELP